MKRAKSRLWFIVLINRTGFWGPYLGEFISFIAVVLSPCVGGKFQLFSSILASWMIALSMMSTVLLTRLVMASHIFLVLLNKFGI